MFFHVYCLCEKWFLYKPIYNSHDDVYELIWSLSHNSHFFKLADDLRLWNNINRNVIIFYWKCSRSIIKGHGISLLSLVTTQNVRTNYIRHHKHFMAAEKIIYCCLVHVVKSCKYIIFSVYIYTHYSFVLCLLHVLTWIAMCVMFSFELLHLSYML